MGYETSLQLVDVEVDPRRRPEIEAAIRKGVRSENKGLRLFLRWLGITSDNTLEFRATCKRDFVLPHCPDDEGFVSAAVGKWHRPEEIAEWLCKHCSSGRLILHSLEGDGAAFGWEFESGRIRYLELRPVGRWRRLQPLSDCGSRKQAKSPSNKRLTARSS